MTNTIEIALDDAGRNQLLTEDSFRRYIVLMVLKFMLATFSQSTLVRSTGVGGSRRALARPIVAAWFSSGVAAVLF